MIYYSIDTVFCYCRLAFSHTSLRQCETGGTYDRRSNTSYIRSCNWSSEKPSTKMGDFENIYSQPFCLCILFLLHLLTILGPFCSGRCSCIVSPKLSRSFRSVETSFRTPYSSLTQSQRLQEHLQASYLQEVFAECLTGLYEHAFVSLTVRFRKACLT